MRKKITICSSMSFWDDIKKWKEKLTKENYEVIKYPEQISGDFLSSYKREFTDHYKKISQSDMILVLNMKKNGIEGYIGAAVFAEIAFAIGLNRVNPRKNISAYCLNPIPESLPHAQELQHWQELGWLKLWR
ncbi:MAG: hypothetical protein R6V40_03410 [Candidatus Moraniibacteriota bacterium]